MHISVETDRHIRLTTVNLMCDWCVESNKIKIISKLYKQKKFGESSLKLQLSNELNSRCCSGSYW